MGLTACFEAAMPALFVCAQEEGIRVEVGRDVGELTSASGKGCRRSSLCMIPIRVGLAT